MNWDQINKQVKLAESLVKESKNQIRIFDDVLQEAIKGVEGDDKKEIERVRALSQRAINLAKQGKGDKAQEIIKNFQNSYGSKNSK